MIIGISGDSGAGKSSLVDFFSNIYKDNLLVIEGDSYHKWERNDPHWKEMTPLNPEANNLDKAVQDLKDLRDGKSIIIRNYNHSNGRFDESKTLNPKENVLLVGLHSLYSKNIRDLEDIKIFLNTDENLRLFWKLKRDVSQRGYSENQVLDSIQRRFVDSEKYIKPQINFADIIINIFDSNIYKDFKDYSYVPELSIILQIDKNFKYLQEVMHLVKNTSFKVEENERFIQAVFSEKICHFKDFSI